MNILVRYLALSLFVMCSAVLLADDVSVCRGFVYRFCPVSKEAAEVLNLGTLFQQNGVHMKQGLADMGMSFNDPPPVCKKLKLTFSADQVPDFHTLEVKAEIEGTAFISAFQICRDLEVKDPQSALAAAMEEAAARILRDFSKSKE